MKYSLAVSISASASTRFAQPTPLHIKLRWYIIYSARNRWYIKLTLYTIIFSSCFCRSVFFDQIPSLYFSCVRLHLRCYYPPSRLFQLFIQKRFTVPNETMNLSSLNICTEKTDIYIIALDSPFVYHFGESNLNQFLQNHHPANIL